MSVYRRKSTTKRSVRRATTQRDKGPSFNPKSRKGKSTANKLSSLLLGANKVIRDINAVQKGQLGDRIVRRAGGKAAGRGLGSLSDFFKK